MSSAATSYMQYCVCSPSSSGAVYIGSGAPCQVLYRVVEIYGVYVLAEVPPTQAAGTSEASGWSAPSSQPGQ
eukprot:11625568-Alexandrium_andersonii.AAC.1